MRLYQFTVTTEGYVLALDEAEARTLIKRYGSSLESDTTLIETSPVDLHNYREREDQDWVLGSTETLGQVAAGLLKTL